MLSTGMLDRLHFSIIQRTPIEICGQLGLVTMYVVLLSVDDD